MYPKVTTPEIINNSAHSGCCSGVTSLQLTDTPVLKLSSYCEVRVTSELIYRQAAGPIRTMLMWDFWVGRKRSSEVAHAV